MNKEKSLKAIKRIKSAISELKENDSGTRLFKVAYELACAIYLFNFDKGAIKLNEFSGTIDNFKKVLDAKKFMKREIFNMNQLYTDIAVVNPNHPWAENAKANIDKINSSLSKTPKMLDEEILPSFIIGVHNRINDLSEALANEENESKKITYQRQIHSYSEDIFKILNSFYKKYSIFKLPFFISAIVKIKYCDIQALLLNREFGNASKELKSFEISEFGRNSILTNKNSEASLECFGLISMLNGEICFNKKDYKNALKYFLEARDNFGNEISNQSAANTLNIGVCYAFQSQPVRSIINFNLSLKQYKELTRIYKNINSNACARYEEKIKSLESIIQSISK